MQPTMLNTPWIAPLRIPEPNSQARTPAWLELSSSPVSSTSTNEETSPWDSPPSVPLLVPSIHSQLLTPRTNFADVRTPPPGASSSDGIIAPWQDPTKERSRQSLPRCAVVSFRKDGDTVRWQPAAPSNSGRLGARIRGFDSAFELEEYSSRALRPRYVEVTELLAMIAAENEPRASPRRRLRLLRRTKTSCAPRIAAPPQSLGERALSCPEVQRKFEEWDFESQDPHNTRRHSGEFEVERPRRGFFARLYRRSRIRSFSRFWRSSRSKIQPTLISEEAVLTWLNQQVELR